MRSELEDLIEHLGRHRAITLQVFDIVEEGELGWQAEDRFAHGLFEGDRSLERVPPGERPDVQAREELGGF